VPRSLKELKMKPKLTADDVLSRQPASVAAEIYDCTDQTLYNRAKRGEIPYTRTPSGRWLFDVRPALRRAA
jgi:hypothetical protein